MAAPANGVACEPERGGARKVNLEDAEAAGGVSHLLLLGLLRQVSYNSHGVLQFFRVCGLVSFRDHGSVTLTQS